MRIFTEDVNGGLLDDWTFDYWEPGKWISGYTGNMTNTKPMKPQVFPLVARAKLYLPAGGDWRIHPGTTNTTAAAG